MLDPSEDRNFAHTVFQRVVPPLPSSRLAAALCRGPGFRLHREPGGSGEPADCGRSHPAAAFLTFDRCPSAGHCRCVAVVWEKRPRWNIRAVAPDQHRRGTAAVTPALSSPALVMSCEGRKSGEPLHLATCSRHKEQALPSSTFPLRSISETAPTAVLVLADAATPRSSSRRPGWK